MYGKFGGTQDICLASSHVSQHSITRAKRCRRRRTRKAILFFLDCMNTKTIFFLLLILSATGFISPPIALCAGLTPAGHQDRSRPARPPRPTGRGLSLLVPPVHEVGRVALAAHTSARIASSRGAGFCCCLPRLGRNCGPVTVGAHAGADRHRIESVSTRCRSAPVSNPSRMPHQRVATQIGVCVVCGVTC